MAALPFVLTSPEHSRRECHLLVIVAQLTFGAFSDACAPPISLVAGPGLEHGDLVVMSHASYQLLYPAVKLYAFDIALPAHLREDLLERGAGLLTLLTGPRETTSLLVRTTT